MTTTHRYAGLSAQEHNSPARADTGIPHLPYNLSDDDYCVALVARTDHNDQERLLLLPGLDRQLRH